MNFKCAFAVATLGCLLIGSAGAQTTWLPPKEIQSKTDAAPPAATTPAPAPTAAKSAAKSPDAAKGKEAKVKDCKAQSLAKGLHGSERKKFLESCKNS